MKKIVSGIESSGSTAVWQALTQLTGEDVIKIHGFESHPNSIAFVTIRDFRDVVASFVRRKIFGELTDVDRNLRGIVRYLEPRFAQLRQYVDQPNAHIIRYENWVGDERALIFDLADILDIDATDGLVDRVAAYISLEKNRERSKKYDTHRHYDKKTNIHGLHVTSNGETGLWEPLFDRLSDESREVIMKILMPELEFFGYLD